MKKNSYFPQYTILILDKERFNAVSCYLGFILFIFYFQLADGQEFPEPTTQKGYMISLKEGTEIFSADESFSRQLTEKKDEITGTAIFYQKGNKLIVSKVNIKKPQDRSFTKQIKETQQQKKANDLQNVQKHIEKYEKQKASVRQQEVVASYSFYFLFNAQIGIGKCAVPLFDTYKFPNTDRYNYVWNKSEALDFLHSKTYCFYNSISLNGYFSEVFSVRPPPSLSI